MEGLIWGASLEGADMGGPAWRELLWGPCMGGQLGPAEVPPQRRLLLFCLPTPFRHPPIKIERMRRSACSEAPRDWATPARPPSRRSVTQPYRSAIFSSGTPDRTGSTGPLEPGYSGGGSRGNSGSSRSSSTAAAGPRIEATPHSSIDSFRLGVGQPAPLCDWLTGGKRAELRLQHLTEAKVTHTLLLLPHHPSTRHT